MSTPEKLARLGQRIEQERVSRGWGKEQAAREAGISSITWKRLEDGLPVQDSKRRAAEIALGWEYGSMDRVMDGREPVVIDGSGAAATPPRNMQPPVSRAVWDAFDAVHHFALLARAAGAAPEFEEDLYTAAIALIGSIARYREVMEDRGIQVPDESPRSGVVVPWPNSVEELDLAARKGSVVESRGAVAQAAAGEESQAVDGD